jgi:endonuclease/exonuclease/phosphatase family metal-dependent hydrolase
MRLLTYNIHKGIGGRDRRYQLERVIRVIEEEKPDIICLQEVARNARRTRYHDQPRLLAEHFNAPAHLYQMNIHHKAGGYGNLVLSRWAFRCRHQCSLQMHSRKPRGAQLVVVDTPEGPLHLVNWHLGLIEKERHWQVGHLLDHHLFCESGHLPTLVVGDFNDWRNTLTGGAFARHDFAQVTAPPSRFRSFPAYLAVLSLDKAFFRGGISVGAAHVVRNHLSRLASDHLPLVLDFHLTNDGNGNGG